MAATLGAATIAAAGAATPAVAADFDCRDSPVCSVSVTPLRAVGKYTAQVDNKYSANGAQSWIWIWTSNMGAHTDYYLIGDGAMHKLYTDKKSSRSAALPADVAKFRACGPNGFGRDECSNWAWPGLWS
ncbi:hypothetical protein [Kribbella albertanoniae]|uniref:Peptidase inhibitor family I36 protein n=1 Tax=Kribbella albertanoniae TaxID=1266829 RepID=A0A4R4Q2R2_9ACTN|nr:hypothetical protein [Kribbella albertanoniae]TDC29274.1 hypothetical protein E1261_16180 [Kribbella albertanoniae]